MDLVGLIISIVVGTIIVAPFLWLAGRSLVGKDKAKFFDAIWIVFLGTIINAVIGAFSLPALLAAVIMFIVWLMLIKHFFDCGWVMAFAIALVAVILVIVVSVILAIIGLVIVATWI